VKTRAELLAQLEAEQASGDPTWRESDTAIANAERDAHIERLLRTLDRALTGGNVVRIHPRARRAA
jgi:hypothetical protein